MFAVSSRLSGMFPRLALSRSQIFLTMAPRSRFQFWRQLLISLFVLLFAIGLALFSDLVRPYLEA